jgi:adenosine deaminase
VFDTTLTREYLLAMQHYGLSVNDLFAMSLSAIEYVFDNNVKDMLKGEWLQWAAAHAVSV